MNATMTSKLDVKSLNFYYGKQQALKDVSITFRDQCVTALIGPSGCGKSTLLRVCNRICDLYPGHHATGEVLLDGENILSWSGDITSLRARVGMVGQRPTPFPMSIYENIAFPLRLHKRMSRFATDEAVERALRRAALWDEVKDKLRTSGLGLSGGQQQRLCIARAIALEPEVLLMDEPASALDPISTALVEELVWELRKDYCIVIVTHNMQQAARVADFVGYMYLGDLVEFDETATIFNNPRETRTQDYITGRMG